MIFQILPYILILLRLMKRLVRLILRHILRLILRPILRLIWYSFWDSFECYYVVKDLNLLSLVFLFSRAQFQENRSIFNTPNPRLMNVSLLKDSKSYHKYSTSSTSKAGSSGSRNRSMRLSSVSSAGGIPKNASSQHQNFSTPISSSEFDRNTSSLHYAPETFKMWS